MATRGAAPVTRPDQQCGSVARWAGRSRYHKYCPIFSMFCPAGLVRLNKDGRLDFSLEAGAAVIQSNIELMITVMDMETSYVIVVYNNDVSFTTSAHTAISRPRHISRGRRERE